MFNLKVDLERRMDLQVKNDKNYEKLRLRLEMTLEALHSKVGFGSFRVQEQMICANTVNQSIMFTKCPICKMDKSFRIPFLN